MAGHSGHRFLLVVSYDSILAPKSMRLFAFLILLASAATGFAQAPSNPTGLTAAAGTGKTIRLNWTAPSGTPAPNGYHVYRGTGSSSLEKITTFGQVGGSVTTYLDSDAALQGGTAYRYVVRAYTGTDSTSEALSNPSNEATATPVATPGAPGNLKATKITSTAITLEWSAVTGATSYNLYRDDEILEEEISLTTYTDLDVEISTSYSYYVTANSTGGESAKSNVLTVSTGDGTGREAYWVRDFRKVDVDASRTITLEEFLAANTKRKSIVAALHRFEYMDGDDSEDITLTEYTKAFGGKKFAAPTKPRQFFLADRYFLLEGEEPDGYLDAFEFALTQLAPVRNNEVKLVKALGKKDENGSEDLSEVEFGIRNGSPYDSDNIDPDTVPDPDPEPETVAAP